MDLCQIRILSVRIISIAIEVCRTELFIKEVEMRVHYPGQIEVEVEEVNLEPDSLFPVEKNVRKREKTI